MLELLPGLINAVRMIYSISSYYNTPERMTSLLVKVAVTRLLLLLVSIFIWQYLLAIDAQLLRFAFV